MDVLESHACETAWAIVDTLYFDPTRHRFVRGDIEIEGRRIARILPPHASQCACLMPGDTTACLPGLIEADATPGLQDWSRYSQQLAAHGVTTAGVFCRTTVSRNFIRRLHLQLDATACRPGTVQLSYENDGLYDCEAYDRNSRSACSTPFTWFCRDKESGGKQR